MRIFLRLLIPAAGLFFSTLVSAQKTAADIEKAFSLVKTNAAAMGLSEADISNSVVSATYQTPDGITMVYLQQALKNIPVYNQLQVAAFKHEKIVSLSGDRITQLDTKVNEPNGAVRISAEKAIQQAAAFLRLAAPLGLQALTAPNGTDNILHFTSGNISQQDITAQVLWTPMEDGTVKLCWQVYIVPANSSDYLLIRVDALSGNILQKTNLTVSCNWDKPASGNDVCNESHIAVQQVPSLSEAVLQSPAVINSATYRVIPYPAESPIHTGGAHALRTDPWLAAAGNATTLQWNSNGTTDFNITRGNNVHAHLDIANNNSNAGLVETSSTPLPDLNFLQAPDYTLAASNSVNRSFALTNLFYWNNIMHDISYQYGFNEVSGNFQANNLSRGGAQNDYVQADAQDAGGTNNANFGTPVDGSQPRMQMYLFTYGTPGKDGDLDNGVIAHEYTHGISNRLTGGPANSSCLQNFEQMGEGWSDFFGLMVTTDWTVSTIADGPLSRGIGNYVLNLPANGTGIRRFPYSTNMSVNPLTYASLPAAAGQPHNIGEIWCSMLWDMAWNMIQIDGINTNLYDAAAVGGNSAALKLVTEGLRLQPCSPGFVDGRNAILRADTLLFGAKYSCAIWDAFARRGLGVNASQGSSNNAYDGVADYLSKTGLASAAFAANKVSAAGNEQIIYTTQPAAGECAGINNYFITDTLPANVTYLSGGSYNAANRVVTFTPVTLASGASASYALNIRVNADAYYPPVTQFTESVPTASLPAAWTATSTVAATWATSTAQSHSGPNSFFAAAGGTVADKRLITTGSFPLQGITTLSFWHSYNFETGFDGGVVEISTDNGTTWSDLGIYFTANGYNITGQIPYGYGNPLSGRRCFTGSTAAFVKSTVNLSFFSGQTAKFRFRIGTDNATATTGWYIDDIDLINEAAVVNKMNVYNSGNVLQYAKTLITPVTSVILPVSWDDFYVQKRQGTSLLTWSTVQEINTLSFTAERSTDGINFTPIAELPAAGNSINPRTYTTVDAQPAKGINYYRVMQKDANGNTDFTMIKSLNYASPVDAISISPNPAKDMIHIVAPGNSEKLPATIIDASGRTVRSFIITGQSLKYDISALPAGVYYVKITGSSSAVVKKLLIK